MQISKSNSTPRFFRRAACPARRSGRENPPSSSQKNKKGPDQVGALFHFALSFSLVLLLFLSRLICCGGSRRLCRWRRSLRSARHAVFKTADAFAKSLHDFRDALTAKENEYDRQDHEPVKNAKFTHETPPRAPAWRRAISTLAQVALRGKSLLFLAPTG
jgi:hypothetical protein